MRRFRQGSLLFLLCSIFLFLSISSALAITTSGSLTEDETWSGTVNLTGDVTVPVGITLTIEAGTTVIFPARSDDTSGGEDSNVTELIINGSLVAIGSADNKITFASGGSIPTSGDWGGIKWNVGLGVKTFDLEYCTIEYPSTAVKWHVNAGIQSGTISNCEIKYTTDYGIYIYGEANADITANVTNNSLSNIGGHGIYGYATGSGTSITGSFSNNTVSDCGSFGIVLVAYDSATGNVDITNNQITDIDDSAIYEKAYNPSSVTGKIEGNTISNAGRDTGSSYRYGIWVYADNHGTTDIDVNNNTVTNTGTYGIYV
ncbi:MAG: hypothetical protein DRG59_02145, partial [Deltaproteobacteria bacterium]